MAGDITENTHCRIDTPCDDSNYNADTWSLVSTLPSHAYGQEYSSREDISAACDTPNIEDLA